METKHTPGPWKSNYRKGTGFDHGYIIERTNGQSIAAINRDSWQTSGEYEANARLIAAAPDALALARAVAGHFKDTDAPLGQMARDFIAKATGA